MQSNFFVKTLIALAALSAIGTCAAAASSPPALAVSTEAMPASAAGLPALQARATQPPDSSPFIPDGPEKQERVKKLLREIQDTNGFEFGSERSIFYGPTVRKLYTLHKRLTDDDWQLLAEMYVNFRDSDLKIISEIPINEKNTLDLNNALEMLLAMHGEASIDMLNAMVAAAAHQQPKYIKIWLGFEKYNKIWQININFIKKNSRRGLISLSTKKINSD